MDCGRIKTAERDLPPDCQGIQYEACVTPALGPGTPLAKLKDKIKLSRKAEFEITLKS